MITIGIIGFGLMGRTHAAAFSADPRCTVRAIADVRGRAALDDAADGTLLGQAGMVDGTALRVYETADELLADDDLDAISVCTPTPEHAVLVEAGLERGRHVIVEKPLALDASEAARVAAVARRHPDQCCLPAMCIRFWPGWTDLRSAIRDRRHGRVRAAHFVRRGPRPTWNQAFYGDARRSGGAILDLHIHDADFVRACFGDPVRVRARGYGGASGGCDHVHAHYEFGAEGPEIVTAEGAWLPASEAPFEMGFHVTFERAVASFSLDGGLTVCAGDDPPETREGAGTGYDGEIRHFLDCIEAGRASDVVTVDDAVAALRLVEAERRSIETGTAVDL